MAAPKYMRPVMELGIWFHELPPLATINGAIIATDASTTIVGRVSPGRISPNRMPSSLVSLSKGPRHDPFQLFPRPHGVDLSKTSPLDS